MSTLRRLRPSAHWVGTSTAEVVKTKAKGSPRIIVINRKKKKLIVPVVPHKVVPEVSQ